MNSEVGAFEEVTTESQRSDGEERYVRTLSAHCWISVLYRRTGFGHMEWETALCFRDAETSDHVKGSPFLVKGDWRDTLASVPEDRLTMWYESVAKDHRVSFDAIMDVLREACDE